MATAFGSTYEFRAPGRTGRVAAWTVAAHALILAPGGVVAMILASGDGEWDLDPSTTTAGGAWATGPVIGPMRIVYAVQAVTAIVAMIAWLTWQSRATENAWAARAPIAVTPGWAVFWWFTPFANMGKPAGSIAQLLRASSAMAGGRSRDGALVAVWWTTFLVGQVLSFVGYVVMMGEVFSVAGASFETVRAADIDEGLWISAAGMLLQAASAWPAIAIVRAIDRRQTGAQVDIGGPAAPAAGVPHPPRPDLG